MSLIGWALVALVVAVIAGALGFGGVASGAATIAKILFGIFLVIAAALFIMTLAGVSLLT